MSQQTLSELVEHLDAAGTETADLYGALAPLYEFVIEFRDIPATQFGTVRATLPDGAESVLELACGMGGLLRELETEYAEVVGLDRSRQLLSLARRKTDAELVRSDVRRPALDGDFDAAVMLGHSMGHLTGDGDVRRCLDAVARALAPGGLFFFDYHDVATYAEPQTRENVADGDRFHVTHEGELGAADERGLVDRTDAFTIRDHEADRTLTVAAEPYAFRARDPEAVREQVRAAGFDVADARSRDGARYLLARRR